jgi:NAD(P)-dependent dehydrogenase (short-subunit alcohol dehydrogenase family)
MNAPTQGEPEPVAGQVVIVTGGGGVIGRAICEAFGRAGALVAVADLSAELLAGTVSSIEEAGGRVLGIRADVTDGPAIEQMVAHVERELGPVDLLVNNAGRLGAIGPLWEVDPDEWWSACEVNLRGVMLCARAVLPGMVSRRRGRIINISSGTVLEPIANFSAYPVSKTAVTRLTEHLAADCREYGLSVFAIRPGSVDSPMARLTWESPAGQKWTGHFREMYAAHHVPPELAARRCLELASGKADCLSGCYIQLADDLDELVGRADEIAAGGLYALRIRQETATPRWPPVARSAG